MTHSYQTDDSLTEDSPDPSQQSQGFTLARSGSRSLPSQVEYYDDYDGPSQLIDPAAWGLRDRPREPTPPPRAPSPDLPKLPPVRMESIRGLCVELDIPPATWINPKKVKGVDYGTFLKPMQECYLSNFVERALVRSTSIIASRNSWADQNFGSGLGP